MPPTYCFFNVPTVFRKIFRSFKNKISTINLSNKNEETYKLVERKIATFYFQLSVRFTVLYAPATLRVLYFYF